MTRKNKFEFLLNDLFNKQGLGNIKFQFLFNTFFIKKAGNSKFQHFLIILQRDQVVLSTNLFLKILSQVLTFDKFLFKLVSKWI